MRTAAICAPFALSLILSACADEAEPEATEGEQITETGPATTGARAAAGPVYSATGDVTEVNAGQVTISHGPVEALGWPAMTMGFTPASGEILEGVDIGDPVAFEFTQEGDRYVLTSIREDR